MNEKPSISISELSYISAALYLHYESDILLEKNPKNTDARNIRDLVASIILEVGTAISPFRKIEEERKKEQENSNVYIATVGLDNVGKGEVTKYIQKKYGFDAHPLSDRIKEIAITFGKTQPFNRDALYDTSKRVKGIFNDAVLLRYAEAIFYQLHKTNRLLFDGIRLEGEATEFLNFAKKNTRAILVAVVSGAENDEEDLKIRYKRSLLRNNEKDPKDFEEYKRKSDREAAGIKASIQHATYVISNKDNELENTFAQVDQMMKEQGIESITTSIKEPLPNSYTISV